MKTNVLSPTLVIASALTSQLLLGQLLVASAKAAQAAPAPTVTVTPAESDDILANPGMGWQIFHRTRPQDKSLPDWIPSTVHYARWGCGTVESRQGEGR
ncbi:MAG: hypothetical protein FJ387_00130 [Verrucomicrobia bacterium]|nr:hypothetical protein [Verrucomicrobiota bacterium]